MNLKIRNLTHLTYMYGIYVFFLILGSVCRPWNEVSLRVHGRLFLHHGHVVGLHVVWRKCPSDGTKARQRQLEKLMVIPLHDGEK